MGIIFPENGLCNAHVSYEYDKGLKRIDLLRMLKGTNWGVSEDPFLCIYRALIRSIIEYAMKIYFNSSESSLKQIEKIETEYLDMCGCYAQHSYKLFASSLQRDGIKTKI